MVVTSSVRPHGVRGLGRLLACVLAALLLAGEANAAPGWSGPRTLGTSAACDEVSATTDADGATFVAAVCDTYVRVSSATSGAWTTVQFGHPQGWDLAPRLALDGARLYVAFTRAETRESSVEPGLGGDFPIGVYYRWRDLPSGSWSKLVRLGNAGDVLESFRVVEGLIHATVAGWDAATEETRDAVIFETTASGRLKRYPLSDATRGDFGPWAAHLSSLQVGTDGRARIVYEGERGLRYATFMGSGFARSAISGTASSDRCPQLALDADNQAHVVWINTTHPLTCDPDEPSSQAGTYYATNTSGAWGADPSARVRRVTGNVGRTSLTLDPASGRPHLIVGGEFGVKYYSPGSGKWNGLTLSNHMALDVAIASNRSDGSLFAAFARLDFSGDDFPPNLYYLTRP